MQFLNTKDKFTLTSSNAYIEDYPIWDNETTYNKDDKVIYKNYIYKSLIDDNSEEPGTGLNWFDEGATNPYRCLDKYVNTQTKNDNNLEMLFDIENSNCIALLNMVAAKCKIEIYTSNDELAFEKEVNTITSVANWKDYFFGELEYINKLIIKFSTIFVGKLKIYLEGGEVALGVLQIGLLKDLGITLLEVKSSIDDYSKKDVDENGFIYLKEGNFADRIECDILLDNSSFNIVKKRLTDIRAKPIVYLASDKDVYRELNLFGIYENFEIRIKNENKSKCSLTLKGLI